MNNISQEQPRVKIDLHIHTKAIAKGDPKTKNIISISDFKDKLRDANVGIAAITNHYSFDKTQFDSLKDDSYILLPGVELDIEMFDGRRVQANVVTDPNNADILLEKTKKFEDAKKIKYDDFINEFDLNQWIILPDRKNSGNTAWKDDELYDLFKKIKNAIIIADTNSARTLHILSSHNFNALIGTDIQDWEHYLEKAQDLMDTQLNINNYQVFWTILKNNSIENRLLTDIFCNINEKEIEKIKIPETEYYVENLKIKSGVNVIFGAKRTGKTEILKAMHEQLRDKSVLYESVYKENELEKMKGDLLNSTPDLFSVEKKEFENLMGKIFSFKATEFKKFHDYFENIKSKSKICFHDKFNFLNNELVADVDTKKIEEFYQHIHDSYSSYTDSKMILPNFEKWDKSNQIILNDVWNVYVRKFKDSWRTKFNISIKNKIDAILSKKKGTIAKPQHLGLYERFIERLNIEKLVNEILNFNAIREKSVADFEIPNREFVKAYKTIYFVDINTDSTNTTHAITNKIATKLSVIKPKVKSLQKSTGTKRINLILDIFKELKNYFKFSSGQIEIPLWVEKIIIKDSMQSTSFSNGEKAHLILHDILSNPNADYFLLDEPAVFLSRESITDFLLPKISELVRKRKSVVIVTHNNSMGINTVPVNYILRKYQNGDEECKTFTGSIWSDKFVDIKNQHNVLKFHKEIIGAFEGSEEHFNFRKEIYESYNN